MANVLGGVEGAEGRQCSKLCRVRHLLWVEDGPGARAQSACKKLIQGVECFQRLVQLIQPNAIVLQ